MGVALTLSSAKWARIAFLFLMLSTVVYSCSTNSDSGEGWGGHTGTPEADRSGGDN